MTKEKLFTPGGGLPNDPNGIKAVMEKQDERELPDYLLSESLFADRLYDAGWRDTADAQWTGAEALRMELLAVRLPQLEVELPFTPDPRGGRSEESWHLIHDTLRNYRMSTLSDGEGDGYPLIDAMTADGQPISGGIEECTYLADAIWNTLNAQGIKVK